MSEQEQIFWVLVLGAAYFIVRVWWDFRREPRLPE